MLKNQNTELKESWNDDVLVYICGMANADGGKIYIGIKDNGEIIGIDNNENLLVEIPNKVKKQLDLIVDVNLLKDNKKEYIEIVVYPSYKPIKYKEEYYYRSGNTNQKISNENLNEIINRKIANNWDNTLEYKLTNADLDNNSFKIVKDYMLKNKRFQKKDFDIDNLTILNNLNLINNNLLTNAAILLFYKDPSSIYEGAYLRIEVFNNNVMVNCIDLKESFISIINKIESKFILQYLYNEDDYPYDAIKEAIYYSILNNDYSLNKAILIVIKNNEIIIKCNSINNNKNNKELIAYRYLLFNHYLLANLLEIMGLVDYWKNSLKLLKKFCKRNGMVKFNIEINDKETLIYIRCINNESNLEIIEFEGKVQGIKEYLYFHNYPIDSLDDSKKEKLYILIEKLIMKNYLTLNEIAKALDIKEVNCINFLKEIINLKIIKMKNNYYSLVKQHNLNI